MRRTVVAMMVAALAGCASQQGSAPVVDRTARAGAPQPPPVTKASAPTPRTLPEDHYEVKRGDTLYSIALEHGVDYRELAQWNGLDDPTRIRVGQVLRVKPEESRVQVSRANIGGRLEYERFRIPNTDDARVFSLSVLLSLL